jgi:hypothetical protein
MFYINHTHQVLFSGADPPLGHWANAQHEKGTEKILL